MVKVLKSLLKKDKIEIRNVHVHDKRMNRSRKNIECCGKCLSKKEDPTCFTSELILEHLP